ncbi:MULTISPECIES: hypothetical protein [Pseudomonas]|uniref:Putative lipoprotein n=1 Tax=Pseudomonas luteola TaxID=47886 RepID=A0A2X2CLH3_PSELU|nr:MULTISPECIES: hypothetical protein [Pseudomonas]MBF8642312.1 hypothetical protein [Pseudomonas zeshuii]RRW48308.1 hypothetical protein EGJ50_10120 [Pseudomonas luteola]SHJ23382.1 hypothetical protein SAMN05216295_109179 [Pseudomonas zeshuii]SPZ07631.1 putative lipoprotein [Pseudomonas luteola]
MRLLALLGVMALAGCATTERIEKRPPSMDAISGKSVAQYMSCIVPKLGKIRREPVVDGTPARQRIVVPQFTSPATAAVIFVNETSRGINVVLHERSSNNPFRPRDIYNSVKECI